MKYNLDNKERDNILKKIARESEPDKYFYVMVISSCVIATYGLLSASAAVIIGSMVIAPLMYPMLDMSLAIILRNKSRLITAIKAEASAMIFSIILATILSIFWPTSIINYEITSRTVPTWSSLIIAFASGVAGTTAICYRPLNHLIAGVAIAVSLIPPMCVAGIELSRFEYTLAFGALLLFLTNVFAIAVAGIIVFKLAGFTTKS